MKVNKFRAWEDGKMYRCIVGNTDNTDDDYICPLIWIESKKDWVHSDTCKIMQYTGMKDKNGKEIYEGDIVRSLHIKAEVIFEDSSFKFKWLDRITKRVRKYNEPMFKNTNIVFEVIGNIYENPELLEG